MRRLMAAAFLIGAVALAGCSSKPGDVRVWTTADGEPVPPRLIEMWRGAEHCGWQNTWFLTTRNPGDTELPPVTQNPRHYIRDPEGALRSDHLKTSYEADVDLPADAVFTGYVSEGAELWVSDSLLEAAVFLKSGAGVERLPLANPPVYCQ